MLIEVGGYSTMVISQLMNYLELTINFKDNCKAVNEFDIFQGIPLFQAVTVTNV